MKKRIKSCFIITLLFLFSVIIVASIYYSNEYPNQEFDAILFTLTTGVQHSAPSVVLNIFFSCIIPVLLLFILLVLPIIEKIKNVLIVTVRIRKKEFSFQLYPIKITSSHKIIYLLLIFVVTIFVFIKCLSIDEYIKNRHQDTRIFEEYYVDAKDVNIQFPSKKRNLIIIIGESFENSVFSKENGGGWDYSIMPELEDLALKNTSFSNTEKLGGAVETYGSAFSAAGNIAITSGIPLKSIESLNSNNNYQGNGNYLGGVVSIRRNFKKKWL